MQKFSESSYVSVKNEWNIYRCQTSEHYILESFYHKQV